MLNRKTLMITIGLLVAIVIISLFAFTYVVKKNNVQFYVAPRNATVKLGDKTIRVNQPLFVEPGNYTLSITAKDFTPLTKDITITESFKSFAFCLNPVNTTLDEYLRTHEDDRYLCEGAAGQAYDEEAQTAIANYPILTHLPYEDGTFAIGQGLTEAKGNVALYVHYSTQKSKDEAGEWIKRYSSRPDDLPPIIYQNDYKQTGRIGGEGSEIDKILTARYPIVKSLPIDAFIFKLGYRIDQSDKRGRSIKLTVESDTPSGRIAALREIYTLGYDAIDYKIEFINFEGELK